MLAPRRTGAYYRTTAHSPLSIVLQLGASIGGTPTGDERPPDDPTPTASEPTIKGNISGSDKKLYHVPSCPNYAKVKIDADKGERMFRTEAEAVAAGWAKAGDCP